VLFSSHFVIHSYRPKCKKDVLGDALKTVKTEKKLFSGVLDTVDRVAALAW